MTKVPLMGASNCSAFLPLFSILGWLGLITSCFLNRSGETEVLLKLGLWELNLEFVLAELTSHRRGTVPFRAVYLPRSPENARATARRVRDVRLWEHRLTQAQHLLYDHHIGSDERVNWSDDEWGGRTRDVEPASI